MRFGIAIGHVLRILGQGLPVVELKDERIVDDPKRRQGRENHQQFQSVVGRLKSTLAIPREPVHQHHKASNANKRNNKRIIVDIAADFDPRHHRHGNHCRCDRRKENPVISVKSDAKGFEAGPQAGVISRSVMFTTCQISENRYCREQWEDDHQ